MNIQCATFSRCAYVDGGFTLMPCVVLIAIIVWISLATLRITDDFRLFTNGRIDRLVAKAAAETALQDAYMHVKMSDDPLSLSGNEVIYEFGSVTGDTFPLGGRMQSIKIPEYQIHVIQTNPNQGISRITATGFGVLATTQFVVQADYAVRVCSDELSELCEREVRQLAWRAQRHD
jgi:Tfp pilus assembly protein PilX